MAKYKQNIINHVALVLDASSSMWSFADAVIKVGDGLVRSLAQRSQEMNQETRITVIVFASRAECVIYDTDVLRLPSLAEFYRPNGRTALVDATLLAIDDLMLTPQKYGDHAFIVFDLTDGQENESKATGTTLNRKITGLPDNWTVAAMVPNAMGKLHAQDYGFPAGNVEIWDASSERGVEESGLRIDQVTSSWMTGRASGIRSSSSVFSTGADAVNQASVAAAGLTPLAKNKYVVTHVPEKAVIKPFVESLGFTYKLGDAYYELVKREEIQATKDVAVMDRRDNKVYVGDAARDLLHLPPVNVKVKPDHNPDYRIFIQSTSTNRVLPEHTKLLVMKH